MKLKFLLLFLIVFVLTSCCRDYAGYDDAWMDPCVTVPPPDRYEYANASDEEKKVMWAEVYVAQAKETELCNSRMAQARKFMNEVKTGGDLK